CCQSFPQRIPIVARGYGSTCGRDVHSVLALSPLLLIVALSRPLHVRHHSAYGGIVWRQLAGTFQRLQCFFKALFHQRLLRLLLQTLHLSLCLLLLLLAGGCLIGSLLLLVTLRAGTLHLNSLALHLRCLGLLGHSH